MKITTTFKPLLAANMDETAIRYPVLASPKLDGVRALVRDGVLLSRNLKRIPNTYTQTLFCNYEHYDGELIVGEPTHPLCYTHTMSGVMRNGGSPNVNFYVFDQTQNLNAPYSERLAKLAAHSRVVVLGQRPIHNIAELLEYEETLLAQGYEGVIIRAPHGVYKCGRSTANDHIMMKIKRTVDAEAKIVGFAELQHNHNPQQVNELGKNKRSSHKANLSNGNTLGAIIACYNGVTFNIGTGFTEVMRADIWANRNRYIGRYCKFKYLPVGVKDAPRHPVWLGLRDPIDM